MEENRRNCCGCCNDNRDIIACLCTIDKEFDCVEEALGHCDSQLKSKILTCLILREINRLEGKIDRIIKCLNCPPLT